MAKLVSARYYVPPDGSRYIYIGSKPGNTHAALSNPFAHKAFSPEMLYSLYESVFARAITNRDLQMALLGLKGTVLGCDCANLTHCHGQILLDFINTNKPVPK